MNPADQELQGTKSMKKLICSTAVLAILSLSPAYAQISDDIIFPEDTATDTGQPQMQKKAREILDTQFKAMDTNNDGRISKDEFITYKVKEYQKRQAKIFDETDNNHDGSLSKIEFEGFADKLVQDTAAKIAEALKHIKQK